MSNWKSTAIVVLLMVFCISIVPQASAQIKPAMVRSVDEPARVPYQVSAAPTCPFLNECYLTGTAVPTGKRLRLTYVQGVLVSQSAPLMFASVATNDTSHPIFMFSIEPTNAFFYGTAFTFNQPTDLYFEAGETPVIEIGCLFTSSIFADSRNRLRLVGYLVDVAP